YYQTTISDQNMSVLLLEYRLGFLRFGRWIQLRTSGISSIEWLHKHPAGGRKPGNFLPGRIGFKAITDTDIHRFTDFFHDACAAGGRVELHCTHTLDFSHRDFFAPSIKITLHGVSSSLSLTVAPARPVIDSKRAGTAASSFFLPAPVSASDAHR